ncbi:hypothetical protein K0M31_014949 [Melipona bicolor]|uniref:Uncharacterized protein n=1 Tax=Melipona bicolor TaxID=60889 RepID=A0AA40KFT7_9HYME|nr:hypothetical protein K0M31_014949 [Melipona bicolor]
MPEATTEHVMDRMEVAAEDGASVPFLEQAGRKRTQREVTPVGKDAFDPVSPFRGGGTSASNRYYVLELPISCSIIVKTVALATTTAITRE